MGGEETKPKGKMIDTNWDEDVFFIILRNNILMGHHALLANPTPISLVLRDMVVVFQDKLSPTFY